MSNSQSVMQNSHQQQVCHIFNIYKPRLILITHHNFSRTVIILFYRNVKAAHPALCMIKTLFVNQDLVMEKSNNDTVVNYFVHTMVSDERCDVTPIYG